MKIVTLLFISLLFFQPSSSVEEVRKQFPEISTEEQADAFIEELKNDDSAEAKGYTAAMVFMKSRFVTFPFTKLKYFKKGKTILDETIIESPSNIEIRYIRFLMQKQIPDFLGYNDNIKEDFNVIVDGIKMSNLQSEMKSEIVKNMLLTKELTKEEKTTLNQLLSEV